MPAQSVRAGKYDAELAIGSLARDLSVAQPVVSKMDIPAPLLVLCRKPIAAVGGKIGIAADHVKAANLCEPAGRAKVGAALTSPGV